MNYFLRPSDRANHFSLNVDFLASDMMMVTCYAPKSVYSLPTRADVRTILSRTPMVSRKDMIGPVCSL